ncbi:MAG: Do family serine endopeptidase [Prevotellaceae bacterium]|jgi:Do/DeqQ family serine protease|nr:Do family serine endopeptidase [Prevotellaceae bacterium]
MKRKKLLLVSVLIGVSFATSLSTVLIYNRISKNSAHNFSVEQQNIPTSFASMSEVNFAPTDFTAAAEKSVHSVVHVKTKYKIKGQSLGMGNPFNDPFFEYFFGQPQGRGRQQVPEQEQQASGSGVIISDDGYIVTNNHVIEKADEIEVTLNDKRTFSAKVIGADANTDIALIKIDAKNLQPIVFGNSDNLRVGEWVLAVGNPFNLTSTVTAGIVSAKARNINILNAEMKIESFIQTDAAINPGNSGGALVNIAGELVGINTAIASQTGSYAGYGFAVPTSIVRKIVSDIKEYGVVQRAVLGVQISDIEDKLAKEKGLETLNGAYVAAVNDNSAAKDGGVKEGDVITEVNGVAVKSVAQLQEQVGRFRPGDEIKIKVVRKNKEIELNIKLKNRSGNTNIVKGADISTLGAEFEEVSATLKYRLGFNSGVSVKSVSKNGAFAKAGIEKGFIVLKINRQTISSANEIEAAYSNALNSEDDDDKVLFVSGVYPNGKVVHYIVNLK